MSQKLHSSNLARKVSYHVRNFPAVFALRGLLDELLNKFSYTVLGRPMDFIPRDPSCCNFYTPGSFHPFWYPALKMIAPLSISTVYFSLRGLIKSIVPGYLDV